MNRFFTLLFAVSCLTAVGQVPENVLTDDMVAWYPFDGNANDFSGYSNHGAINGAQLTEDRFGEANGAFYFSGGTNIQIPHNPQIDFATGDSLTWAIWVLCHPDEVGSVFEKWLNSFVPYPPFHIRVDAVQGGAQVSSSGYCGQNGQSAGVSTVIPWNTWTHVAFTSSASHYNYFIDGQLVTSADIPQVGCTNDHPLTIGTRAGASHAHYEGKVDDFGIWSRTFSPEEIEALYSLSSPIEGCTDANACNYNEEAQWEDGSCHFNCQFCHVGTVWDEGLFKCVVANPADINLDGCVQLNDLLDLLSAYGNCGAEEENDALWSCGDPLEYQGYDYETVQIGDQCWFAENLRAENYRNGESIVYSGAASDWETNGYTGLGCRAAYNDDATLGALWGYIYNGFAVNDERALCPTGWIVPKNADWLELGEFLGGMSVAGYKMKNSPNDEFAWNGDNSSGFGGYATGDRHWPDGSFNHALDGSVGDNEQVIGLYWSGAPGSIPAQHYYALYEMDDELTQSSSNGPPLGLGAAVRCIQNAE